MVNDAAFGVTFYAPKVVLTCLPIAGSWLLSGGAALFYSADFSVRLVGVIKVCYDYISRTE
ncbi:hypothetical protein M493_10420 [Geobacillus genomosp. 3]|uniref:Uncharacterized protein n=1 Tax=Geobacillus genomosp. 3 TaxID=1921421 RepID=S5ZDQ7_GEOG3|nr:hypothetical protein M493_10420 [Geobacillus genomosp. 3]